MSDRIRLITAAGGNGTAIQVIDEPLSRDEYVARGGVIGRLLEEAGAEQTGFVVLKDRHFEMAGGEFCGNATRGAAVVLSEAASGAEHVQFTTSGFNAKVTARVQRRSRSRYFVRCELPGLPVQSQDVELPGGESATLVDMGGIVHVVATQPFPQEAADHRRAHAAVVEHLGLGHRDAVGVVWCRRQGDAVRIDPVVWVRSVDTTYHETSCGSGSIAASFVTGATSITQPSGQPIHVEFTREAVTMASEMELLLQRGELAAAS